MRAAAIVLALFAGAGCSAIYDGHDLMGTAHAGGSGGGSAGGSGGGSGGGSAGGSGGGNAGGGGTGAGGGGTSAACTPKTTISFMVSTPSVVGNSPEQIASADIDGDGIVDIVTANNGDANFSVMLGDGAGSFALDKSSPVASCSGPAGAYTSDLNGDHLADLIITCWAGTTSPVANVYVNESTPGHVAFAQAAPVTLLTKTPMGAPLLAVGNFDGDGKPDLALIVYGDNTLRIYAGDGKGGFGTPLASYPTGANGSYITAGDLNNDGIDDLVVYNDSDYDLTMFLSTKGKPYTGTTLAYDVANTTGTLYYTYSPVTLVDHNGDGLLDILAPSATTNPGTFEVFLNSGTKTAPAFPTTPTDISTMNSPLTMKLADFNCDGLPDIAASTNGCEFDPDGCTASNNEPPELWVMPGHGTGYDAAIPYRIAIGANSIVVVDANRDGYPDVVAGSLGTTITVLLNTSH